MSQLPNKGKLLSLDLGTQRTGVAVSDTEQRVAFPREEILHKSTEELIQQLNKIIIEEEITGILAGLPINMKGEVTDQTEITMEMINELKAAFKLPVQLADERMTSQEAHKNTGQSIVDSEVARILLENHFNSAKL
jgi:putative holliday junction resolvase